MTYIHTSRVISGLQKQRAIDEYNCTMHMGSYFSRYLAPKEKGTA